MHAPVQIAKWGWLGGHLILQCLRVGVNYTAESFPHAMHTPSVSGVSKTSGSDAEVPPASSRAVCPAHPVTVLNARELVGMSENSAFLSHAIKCSDEAHS